MTETIATERTIDDIENLYAKAYGNAPELKWPEQCYRKDDGTIGLRPARENYKVGDPNLPVAPYREMTVDLVDEHKVVVVQSPTGTGKSTQIVQWLMESGSYSKVIETQPRVVAARSVAEWIRVTLEPLLDKELARSLVGWQTAPDSDAAISNLVSVITDGIQIQRELHGNGLKEREVLLIDECHEKSENMQILMLIAKKVGLHVVIMSATIDADRTAHYYADEEGVPAPIVSIEARTHIIEERDYRVVKTSQKKQRGGPKGGDEDVEYEIQYRTEVDAILDYAKQGKDIQLFIPSISTINKIIGLLAGRLPSGYTVLALHGEQTPEEQERALADYP
ncbi:MAG: DEAD/DEAH box helicase, partial [Candidatus Saccharimonadales bacterium]